MSLRTDPSADDGRTSKNRQWSVQDLAGQLESYIKAQTGHQVVISDLRRFSAGLSWVTFGFAAKITSDASVEVLDLILRLGDPNGLLAPYTARPEFLVLTALADRPSLPLPHAYWYSDDQSILGAPFLITRLVPGDTPLPPWGGGEAPPSIAKDSALTADFVDALVAIHTFEWCHSPIAALSDGVSETNATQREIQRWVKRMERKGDQSTNAAMHYAARWLMAHAPVAPKVCVLHGDYRVGNFLQQTGRITAILDWELTHLGDPHEDLAWAGARTWGGSATTIGGLFDRAEFYRRYEEKTELKIDIDAIRYHEVLAQFKVAAMLIGAMNHIEEKRAQDIRMAVMSLQLAPTLTGLFGMMKAAS